MVGWNHEEQDTWFSRGGFWRPVRVVGTWSPVLFRLGEARPVNGEDVDLEAAVLPALVARVTGRGLAVLDHFG